MVKVSVYCLTYNHEKYIRDALEGFVNQIVDFEFEVFVHDDASTDGTPNIIEEYARKYPHIIKPIYQNENQYSQGINITKMHIYPRMQGKYIAVCEGDDFWCSPFKLQKQVDFLDAHPDYSACVHNTKIINCRTGKESYINKSKYDCDLKFEDIISHGNSQFQISSLMYRKELFTRPKELYMRGVGDYPLSVYLILKGSIYYYSEVMSTYRLFAEGSWTSRHNLAEDKISKQKKHNEELSLFLDNVNLYTNGIYNEIIIKTKRKNDFRFLCLTGEEKKAILMYKDIFMQLKLRDKIVYIIKAYMPFVVWLYKKIRG